MAFENIVGKHKLPAMSEVEGVEPGVGHAHKALDALRVQRVDVVAVPSALNLGVRGRDGAAPVALLRRAQRRIAVHILMRRRTAHESILQRGRESDRSTTPHSRVQTNKLKNLQNPRF